MYIFSLKIAIEPLPEFSLAQSKTVFLVAVQLNYGIDESYKLSVPATGNPIYAHIQVGTAFYISFQTLVTVMLFYGNVKVKTSDKVTYEIVISCGLFQ